MVTFTASDDAGNEEKGSASVTVVDSTAPKLNVPEDIRVEAEGPDGTPATSEDIQAFLKGATAADVVDSSPEVSNDAPEVFPLGETVVTFTASDDAGNKATGTANVTVVDTKPPDKPIDLRLVAFSDKLEVTLEWRRPPDSGTGVDFYNVMVGQELVGTADDNVCVEDLCRFTTPAVTPGEHIFGVAAVDMAGNTSDLATLVARIFLPWDVNEDGVLDVTDLKIVAAAIGAYPDSDIRADVNGDGVIDVHDLVLIAFNLVRKQR